MWEHKVVALAWSSAERAYCFGQVLGLSTVLGKITDFPPLSLQLFVFYPNLYTWVITEPVLLLYLGNLLSLPPNTGCFFRVLMSDGFPCN